MSGDWGTTLVICSVAAVLQAACLCVMGAFVDQRAAVARANRLSGGQDDR